MLTVVGSINFDVSVRTKSFPRVGETVSGDECHLAPGGKGANQAIQAAALGSEVHLVGRLGDDPFGDAALSALQRAGVGTQHVARDPAGTGIGVVWVAPGGDNRILVVPRANAQLTPNDIESAASVIEQSSLVLVQMEIPVATVCRLVELAASRDVPVLLNLAPASVLPAAMHAVRWLLVNQTEAAALTRASVSTPSSLLARRLLKLGPHSVIVTSGPAGAILVDNRREHHIAAEAIDTVVDTTGAGDAFAGGFAAAIDQRADIEEALRLAAAAAGEAVTRRGAQLPA